MFSIAHRQIILAVVVVLLAASHAVAVGEKVLSASNQDHLWFVTDFGQRRTSFVLCHHAADMGGAFFRPQATLTQMPVAIASWDRRVWLAFPPKRDSGEYKWEVFTMQVLKNPLGVYYSQPAEHLDVVAPLSGAGQLLSFVGTAEGPAALMLSGPDQGDNSAKPRLVRLHNDQWLEINAPDDLRIDQDSRLTTDGPRGQVLSLLGPSLLNPKHSTKHERDALGHWTSSELPLSVDHMLSLTSVGNQLVAAMSSSDGHNIEIGYLRPDGFASLASVASPAERWEILGMERSLMLLERSGDGSMVVRTIDPLDGQVSATQPLQLQRLDAGRLFEFSVLLGVFVASLLLVFLIRPPADALLVLPPGKAPLPAGLRLTAFMIDLIPGAALTLLIFRCPISDLLMMPVMTLDFQESAPHMVMVAITMFHSTLGEIIKHTTLGKSIVGGEIVMTNGSRPRVGPLMLRNVLKGIMLLIPPLAVVTVLTRHLQGLHDIAARTIVVHDASEQSETDTPID